MQIDISRNNLIKKMHKKKNSRQQRRFKSKKVTCNSSCITEKWMSWKQATFGHGRKHLDSSVLTLSRSNFRHFSFIDGANIDSARWWAQFWGDFDLPLRISHVLIASGLFSELLVSHSIFPDFGIKYINFIKENMII